MGRKTVAKLLLALAGLLVLTVPTASAAETLVLTCKKCDELIVTAKDLPANDSVRVGVVDVKTGQETTGQFYVDTDANGAFIKKIPMDLGKHPSLESTVWRKDGNVLVVAAHTRFVAPCKPSDTEDSPSPGRTPRCCSAWGWCCWWPAASCSAARAGPTGRSTNRSAERPWPRGSPGPRHVWEASATRLACSWPRSRCRAPGRRPWPPRRASRAGRRPR